jgi:hypothetical protein
LFEEEIVDELQGRFRTGPRDCHKIFTQTEGQLVERQKMDIEEGPRLVKGEYLFEMLDQGGRGNNDGERSKAIADLTGPNVLDQGTIENRMKRPGDNPKHQEP